MYCKQVVHATSFRSNQTNRIFQMWHNLICKSKYVIYLLEGAKCKIQYVRNAETEFNIRLNNHRKDVWKQDAIPASRYFSDKNRNFNTHDWTDTPHRQRQRKKEKLKQRENFWILTREILIPKRLHHFVHLFSLPKWMLILLNYYVITNCHITN